MFGDANVKLGKLKKQLLRDLKASPKKAAILGVLLLIAAWFWAPLLLKKKGSPATEQPGAGAADSSASAPLTARSNDAAASTVNLSATPAAKHSWRQLMELIENDPRMSAPEQFLEVDPFRRSVEPQTPDAAQEVEEKAEPTSAPPAAETPESLGLALSGTLIGTRGRVAIINGRPYGVGREIVVREKMAFVVVEVTRKRAVLEREGQRLVLETARPAGKGTLELRRDER